MIAPYHTHVSDGLQTTITTFSPFFSLSFYWSNRFDVYCMLVIVQICHAVSLWLLNGVVVTQTGSHFRHRIRRFWGGCYRKTCRNCLCIAKKHAILNETGGANLLMIATATTSVAVFMAVTREISPNQVICATTAGSYRVSGRGMNHHDATGTTIEAFPRSTTQFSFCRTSLRSLFFTQGCRRFSRHCPERERARTE